jgi:cysteine desulfurase / selenocysteine lyase
MNDISPELIAEIATRLYNEIPGAAMVPKTESDLSHLPTEPPAVPAGVPSLPGGGGTHPAGAGFAQEVPHTGYVPDFTPDRISLPDFPGFTPSLPVASTAPEGAALPGISGAAPSWGATPSQAGTTPESFSVPGAAGISSQGYSPTRPDSGQSGFGIPGLSALSPSFAGVPSGPGATPEAGTQHFTSLPTGPAGASSQGYNPTRPDSGQSGFGIPGLSALSPSFAGIPSYPGTTPEVAGQQSAPPRPDKSATENQDGLAAFVQQIRSGNLRNDSGHCQTGHDDQFLQQLFARKRGDSAAPAPATGSRPLDIPAIRKDFPALNQKIHGKDLAWLDNGATTQKPQSVIDAISRFYENDNSNIHRGAHTLAARATDAYEQARQKVQGFIGASSSKDIVFVRGTTEGVNFVAQTYGRKFLQPGDEIIVSILEHHANIVPWQMIAKEKGAVIRVIPVNDRGELMQEAYQQLLGPRTKLVALTQASNSLGTINPVAEMTHAAKRYGARVIIDGAQSVSHMPVNMQEIGCDFFVFSGHKIFAPTGTGVVYIKEELHDILPPWHGGGNMIKNVTFEETTYNEAPAKFEAGTPNIADAVGLGAALDYVNRLGLVNTGRYEHELLEYATEQLSRINGLRLIGNARDKVSVISFVLSNRKTEEVGKLLDQEGIAVRAGHHCAQPSLRRFGVETTVRPSFAFYNTFDEIDRLADAVRRIQQN